jgi:cell division topological specificity factor
MGLFDFLRAQKKTSAESAKERLTIIVQQQRRSSQSPDYLPTLQRELLEVIRKYVAVEPDAVQIKVHQDDSSDLLELSVTLPPCGNKKGG